MNSSDRGPSKDFSSDLRSELPTDECFTVVFRGNLRDFDGNPFHADTPFGRAEAIGLGDAFSEIDRLKIEVDRLTEELEDAKIEGFWASKEANE